MINNLRLSIYNHLQSFTTEINKLSEIVKPNNEMVLESSDEPVERFIFAKYFGVPYIRDNIVKITDFMRIMDTHIFVTESAIFIPQTGVYCIKVSGIVQPAKNYIRAYLIKNDKMIVGSEVRFHLDSGDRQGYFNLNYRNPTNDQFNQADKVEICVETDGAIMFIEACSLEVEKL